MQGIEFIIKAAKSLEDEKNIEFVIIGSGQEKGRIVQLANELNVENIYFFDKFPQLDLPEKIAESDVCLGIFGSTEKTRRVIPNKVFECVAMKKAVITADTPAIKELFAENELCLVKIADYQSIAETIIKLKNNRKLIEEFENKGYEKFLNIATINNLGYQLLKIVEKYAQ